MDYVFFSYEDQLYCIDPWSLAAPEDWAIPDSSYSMEDVEARFRSNIAVAAAQKAEVVKPGYRIFIGKCAA